MKKIPLTQEKIALIDDDDFELVNKYKWCAVRMGKTYYATRKFKNKIIRMHRLIMKIDSLEFDVHHIDGNGLNNQKSNLEILTRSQHLMTRNGNKNTSSKYKGVFWDKDNKKWRTQIRINNKNKHLGSFDIEIEAAKAYDKTAIKYFSEFAKLNFNY